MDIGDSLEREARGAFIRCDAPEGFDSGLGRDPRGEGEPDRPGALGFDPRDSGQSSDRLQGAKFLRDLLLFPYVDGLNFVFQFRKRQPWSALTALYRDPPRSTAQILHPDKRLATREDPIPITLPDLGTLAPGVKVVTED